MKFVVSYHLKRPGGKVTLSTEQHENWPQRGRLLDKGGRIIFPLGLTHGRTGRIIRRATKLERGQKKLFETPLPKEKKGGKGEESLQAKGEGSTICHRRPLLPVECKEKGGGGPEKKIPTSG